MIERYSLPRPRAIATDCDWTIMANKDGSLPSPLVKETILWAKKRVPFSLITGRPLAESRYVMNDLALQDPCVLSNGAHVVDPKTGETISQVSIEHDDMIGIRSLLEDFHVRSFIVDNGEYNRDWYRHSQKARAIKTPLTIFTRGMEQGKADDLEEFLQALFGTRVAVHQFISRIDNKPAVMMMHAQATKLHGIMVLKRELGIDFPDWMGMGDGENDLPLLMATGIKVAMGNAHPKLKDFVRGYEDTGHGFIAPDFNEDGAAAAIKRYLPAA